ncbi:AtuA-related protein [Lignipirellula cremea]|uniref:AtuA-like ferredoxin-fold domain-containing protein n=1 Tax=Lignipirellula cremea TaxID=2528010 RepID=A0A518DWH0_9BACT|nr:hypothetical protein [Lignipirellula cremea]QDU96174.1 hypothetical protein Pla8534_39930 [Lignipirellula cremea]
MTRPSCSTPPLEMQSFALGQIASARSGDKGNHANIGVIAVDPAAFAYLQQELTVERVAAFFKNLGADEVVRFELPKVGALNFLLKNVLAGGASQSLRIDTQGKLLGQALLSLQLPGPFPEGAVRRAP